MTIVVDHAGNNYAVECLSCHKVYIVSEYIHKGGRVCPHCGKSRAYANQADKSVVMHLCPDEREAG